MFISSNNDNSNNISKLMIIPEDCVAVPIG